MTTSRDELTPFVENYTDVFVKHVLSRVIERSRSCRCRDAPEDAVPTNFVWCLVLRAVSRALRNAVPPYRTLVEKATAGEKWYGSVPNEELRRVMCVRSMLLESRAIHDVSPLGDGARKSELGVHARAVGEDRRV